MHRMEEVHQLSSRYWRHGEQRVIWKDLISRISRRTVRCKRPKSDDTSLLYKIAINTIPETDLTKEQKRKLAVLPALNVSEHYGQAVLRPDSDPSHKVLLHRGVRHAHLEPTNPRCQQAHEFGFSKDFANAAPSSLQESQVRVVAPRPTRVRLAFLHPPVRVELESVFSPELKADVNRPYGNVDTSALRYALPKDLGVSNCVAAGHGDRRHEPKYFVADRVEVRNVIDLQSCHSRCWISDRWEARADCLSQSSLNISMLAEQICSPGHSRGSSFVSSC